MYIYNLKEKNMPNIPNIPKNETKDLYKEQIEKNGIFGINGIKNPLEFLSEWQNSGKESYSYEEMIELGLSNEDIEDLKNDGDIMEVKPNKYVMN